MKFTATLHGNMFEADGLDKLIDPGFEQTFCAWLNAQKDSGVDLAQLVARLKAANDAAADAVRVNTPTP